MNLLSNRTAIRKVELALGDLTTGIGFLKPAPARKFLELIVNQAVLMKEVTVRPMASPREPISTIGFADRVLRPAHEGKSLAPDERSKPQLSGVELSAHDFKAEVHLSDAVLRDNMEEQQLQQTIMQRLSKRVAADMEDIILHGDTAARDSNLAVLDGLLTQAKSHIADAAGKPMSPELLDDMLAALPERYANDEAEMRFYTSVASLRHFRGKLGARATNLGDRVFSSNEPIYYGGIRLTALPLLRSNLGDKHDQTNILLCHAKNIHVGIRQDVQFETARDISAGVTKIVATVSFDAKYENEDAVAKCIQVQP